MRSRGEGLVSQSPSPAPEPAPTGRGVQEEGQTQGPAGRAGRPGAKTSSSPPLPARGCQVSCLERKPSKIQQGKRGVVGGGKSGPGQVFASTRTRMPLPRPEPHAPAQASPATGFREESRAGWLCAPINLPGGRRAGGGRAGWGLFVTLLPRSPRSPGSGLRRSLPLAAAASAGAICCCRFWRSAIQKQTSSMTTNSYSQMY